MKISFGTFSMVQSVNIEGFRHSLLIPVFEYSTEVCWFNNDGIFFDNGKL